MCMNKSINGLPLSYLLAPHFCHCSRLPINTQHSTLKGGGGWGGGLLWYTLIQM